MLTTAYQQMYLQRRVAPEDAARLISSHNVCVSDIALLQSEAFYHAVARRVRQGELEDITQHTLLELGAYPFYAQEDMSGYRGVSWFSGAWARQAAAAGRADIMPCDYQDVPALFRGYISPDVFIGAVSPMDRHGYFSMGCSASVSGTLLQSARQIFLEVNPHMPRSLYGPMVHISQVTALWENDAPLYCRPPSAPSEAGGRIGAYIAGEVPNGATIQLGIGAIPDAVGAALKDKRSLGVHTELFTDSLLELIECGAADNTAKPIHREKSVAAFAMGSQRLYDYIDDNPAMAMLPVEYVNDPAVIARHPNFISVNAAVEMDFFGQVCAESLGGRHLSGTGGQSDFVRGAVRSPGGKSFIAFPAAAQNGSVSRIVPSLSPGSQVTTSKNDVDRIVTEYGAAQLRGKTLSQRAKELIRIAHPQFREELRFEAKRRNILI